MDVNSEESTVVDVQNPESPDSGVEDLIFWDEPPPQEPEEPEEPLIEDPDPHNCLICGIAALMENMQLHINWCRQQHPELPMWSCPFNPMHSLTVLEKTRHLETCPDRFPLPADYNFNLLEMSPLEPQRVGERRLMGAGNPSLLLEDGGLLFELGEASFNSLPDEARMPLGASSTRH